jgi:hypothetical protein
MEPITREEMYLAAAAGYDITPPEPITRKEFFLAKLAGMDVQLPATFSREEMFLDAVAQRSPAAVIEALNVTENGVYTAGNGVDGYSPVTVDIPDPVLQDKTITENGTYTADEGFVGLGSVLVNVAAAGGDIKIKRGNVIPSSSAVGARFNLDIGFVPDLIVVYTMGSASTSNGLITAGRMYIGYSTSGAAAVGMTTGRSFALAQSASSWQKTEKYKGIEFVTTDTGYPIYNADETGFNVGGRAPTNQYSYDVIALKFT